ncbi:MAG: tetratricopeptide repeat protein [Flavobacteriaceae bacterium]|nr:tetratricopeptide repeat protein [Flavobacteriaceae bacterium]
MKRLICILCFIISFQSFAQTFADKGFYLIDSLVLSNLSTYDIHLIDSALTIFHDAKEDTNRIAALGIICENMMHNDWHKFQYFQQNLIEKTLQKKLTQQVKIRIKHSLASSLNNLGYINIVKGNTLNGLNYYERALKIQKELGDTRGEAISYNNIGLVYYNQGDIPLSLNYFHASLKIKRKIDDKRGIANSYINIGGIYRNQGDIDLALDYYLKAHSFLKELKDRNGVAGCLNHIGFIYETRGDISLALEYYKKSLSIVYEIGNKASIAISYGNIGNIYKTRNEIPLARKNLTKSLKIREELSDKDGIVVSLIKLGQLDLAENDFDNAEKKGLRSLELSKEMGYPKHVKMSALLLSQVYERKGNGIEALAMFKLSTLMNDSIINENTKKTSIKQQAKFEYEKQKVQDDANHDKLIAIELEEKDKQRIIIYATITGLILIAVFLFFVFNRLQITRKQNKVIKEQKVIVEKAKHELEEKNQEITDSITYAKRIQEAILPTKDEVKELLPNSFIFYQPKDIVAGDFYWIDKKEEFVLFAAADCTGHGVPGAMVSVVCYAALNRVIRDYDLLDPGKILDKTREIVIEQLSKTSENKGFSMENMNDGMDIALCVLNTKTNQLKFSGANNPLWILRSGAEEIEETKANKQSIKRIENPIPFITHELKLSKGDCIYVFSDGFADQFGGEKGKKLKHKPFKQMLLSMKDETMDNQLQSINNQFNAWKGNLEQVDDVCIIGVRI